MEQLERKERVKAESGTMVMKKDAVGNRWPEYFERLLNVEEDREPVVVAVGKERGMNRLGELNEKLITRKELQKSVKEMKPGKAAGFNECAPEYLISGGVTFTDWLVRVLNVCFVSSTGPVD